MTEPVELRVYRFKPDGLDPITVYIEQYSERASRMTVQCYAQAWTCFRCGHAVHAGSCINVAPAQSVKSCQTGWGDICHMAKHDGITCPDDSCDIDDGIRAAPAQSGEPIYQVLDLPGKWFDIRKQDFHNFAGQERRIVYAAPQPFQPAEAGETTYASSQATNCAKCGEHKHTPLRIDWMGGYVCLTCIDKELEARVPAVVQDEQLDEIELCRHCDLPVEAPGYCVCNGARYEREHRAASPQSPDGRVIDKAMVKRLAVQHGLLPAQTERAMTLDEYHEDYGFVVWWAWQDGEWLGEPAWIGAPSDSDWPGYHTHWTKHPAFPAAAQPASGGDREQR